MLSCFAVTWQGYGGGGGEGRAGGGGRHRHGARLGRDGVSYGAERPEVVGQEVVPVPLLRQRRDAAHLVLVDAICHAHHEDLDALGARSFRFRYGERLVVGGLAVREHDGHVGHVGPVPAPTEKLLSVHETQAA